MRTSYRAAGCIFGLALIIAVIDQVVKGLVVGGIPLGESHPILPGVLSLTYQRNIGVAFSGLQQIPMSLIIVLNLLMIGVFMALMTGHVHLRVGKAAAVLVLGGAIGNLFDRITRQYVVDYLDIHIWPVFNIADVCIVAGVALLLVVLFRADHAQSSAKGGM